MSNVIHVVNVLTGESSQMEVDNEYIVNAMPKTFAVKSVSKDEIIADGIDEVDVIIQRMTPFFIDGTREPVAGVAGIEIRFEDGSFLTGETNESGEFEFAYSTFLVGENKMFISDEELIVVVGKEE